MAGRVHGAEVTAALGRKADRGVGASPTVDRVRLLPRSLIFDVCLGLIAAVTVVVATGLLRQVAAFVLFMCVLWVPWDLLHERRSSSP